MRKTDKDRAIKKKQKQAIMAIKLNCGHRNRFASGNGSECRLTCRDCGEVIRMLSHTVSGTGVDPQAVKKSLNTKHG